MAPRTQLEHQQVLQEARETAVGKYTHWHQR